MQNSPQQLLKYLNSIVSHETIPWQWEKVNFCCAGECVFSIGVYLIQSNVMGTAGKHPPSQKMHRTPASLLHVFVSAYSLSFQFSGFFIFFFFFSSFSAHIFPLFNPLVFSNFLLGLLTGHSLVLCWLI